MSFRLRTKNDFDRVLARGKPVASEHLVLRVLERGDDLPTRFGWVISKRVGGAVYRNRLRRQLRARLKDVKAGFDCVVLVRNPEIEDLSREVDELLEKSGLREAKAVSDG